RWTVDKPPELMYALILLAILISSSIVCHYGEIQAKKHRHREARIILLITFVMGLGFLALQSFEYLSHWRKLTPNSDAYGSIFFFIATAHAAIYILSLWVARFGG